MDSVSELLFPRARDDWALRMLLLRVTENSFVDRILFIFPIEFCVNEAKLSNSLSIDKLSWKATGLLTSLSSNEPLFCRSNILFLLKLCRFCAGFANNLKFIDEPLCIDSRCCIALVSYGCKESSLIWLRATAAANEFTWALISFSSMSDSLSSSWSKFSLITLKTLISFEVDDAEFLDEVLSLLLLRRLLMKLVCFLIVWVFDFPKFVNISISFFISWSLKFLQCSRSLRLSCISFFSPCNSFIIASFSASIALKLANSYLMSANCFS